MRQYLMCVWRIGILLILVFVLTAPVWVQAQQQEPLAEQQYKNIQALKGIPASQVVPTMHLFAADLGEPCVFCHVQVNGTPLGYFDRDDKETKKTARRMIAMMVEINKNFGGAQVVTCYTCHRGSHEPLNIPSLPVVQPANPKAETTGPALPTVDQILSKYVEALGGEQAIRHVTSRVIIATEEIPISAGGAVTALAQVERLAKAPNLLFDAYHTDKLSISDGFNGITAWVQAANGLVDAVPNPDQKRVRRSADFYESLDLQKEYTLLEVQGTEDVNGHDTYIIVGFPREDTPERLYFDKETGLLLRKAGILPTAAGNLPFRVDYDDYRDTGSGVKIPFVVRMVPLTPREELFTSGTFRVRSVKDNPPLDDAQFAQPESKRLAK